MAEAFAKNFFQQTDGVAPAAASGVCSSETTKEEWMNKNVLQIAKRLIPVEEIALVEPYTPSAESGITTEKEFKSRIVLLDRFSVLSEEAPETIAERFNFHLLDSDRAGLNLTIGFRVEAFSPSEGFNPTKPYQSRLLWSDARGAQQSKLMLAAPDDLLAAVRTSRVPVQSQRPRARSPGKRKPNNTRRAPREQTLG